MTNSAAPGWYVDPANPTVEHWWNGSSYSGSRPVASPVAPPPPAGGYGYTTYAPVYGPPVSPKSRTVAVVLGAFLGGLGVDRFYLGNIGMGVAKLLVGWLTLGIWPLVDFIIIVAGAAHDGQGLPVKDWQA